MKQRMANQILESTTTDKLKWKQKICLALGLALVLTGVPAGICMAAEPASAPPVKAEVYAKHVGNKIVYHYRVFNNSPRNIAAISIGRDSRNDDNPDNDFWELTELPSAWNIKFGIPSASSNSPMGWRVSLSTPSEDSNTHAITWEISNDKSPVLGSGESLAKMSIALDKADTGHLTGHAMVTFSEGRPAPAAKGSPASAGKSAAATLTVPLDMLDTVPPTLAVAVTPNTIWPADNKLVPVNVSFPEKDDYYDHLPEIKLESIIANEPIEPDDIRDASYGIDDRHVKLRAKRNGSTDRIYTITYSATDASGNQTLASATVTVPANEPVAAAVAPPPAPAPVVVTAPRPAPAPAPAPTPTPAAAGAPKPATTPGIAPKPATTSGVVVKPAATPGAAPSRQ